MKRFSESARGPGRERSAGGRDRGNGWRCAIETRLGGAFKPAPHLRFRSAVRREPHLRRRLLLALAVAEEELMRRHASTAAGFVRETTGELPFDRALALYLRLADVPNRDRRLVAVRALAALDGELPQDALQDGDTDTLLHRILHRLGGRRRPDLRARVGKAARRAREAIYRAHLRGADRVASVLEDAVGRPEAIQYYLEAMDVPPGWAERIFHSALGPAEEVP